MTARKIFGAVAATLIAVSGISAASAADFPRKPVTVVVGFGAGGGTDSYARALASVAPEYINLQPLVIVNKPGGSGVPAAKYVAESKADGHTLYLSSGGSFYMSTQFRKAPVDPFEDFKFVCMVGRLLPAIMVHKDSPITSAKQLVEEAKKNPGKLRFATPGRTSTWSIAGMGFAKRNGFKAQDVPAKGGAPARGLVIGKQVDFGVFGIHLRSGFQDQLRVLGMLFPERDPNNKDVPTMKELGLEFTEVLSPMILMAPKGVPDDRVKALESACEKMTAHKAYKRILGKAGLPAIYKTGAEAHDYFKSVTGSWKPLIDEIKNAKTKK